MEKAVTRWFEQAKDDLGAAQYNFEGKKYKLAAFMCQQSAEKALKAVLLSKTGKIRKIHDLVELGKNVDLPSELLNSCKELTLAYIYSRYPDIKEVKNLNKIVKKFLKVAEDILKWARKQL